jgi:hypothetical protein
VASKRKGGRGRDGGSAGGGARGEPEQAGPYPILFAEGNLNYRIVEVSHPVAYGREILVAAETHPRDNLSLFVIRLNGDIEDVPLDQLIDLRDRGAAPTVPVLQQGPRFVARTTPQVRPGDGRAVYAGVTHRF